MALSFDALNWDRKFTKNELLGIFHPGLWDAKSERFTWTKFRLSADDERFLTSALRAIGQGHIEKQVWQNGKFLSSFQAFIEVDEIKVILDGTNATGALNRGLIFPKGKVRDTCDGGTYSHPRNKPWECETGHLSTSKAAHLAGHRCRPRVYLHFRLLNAPELGVFEFQSNAWKASTAVAAEQDRLAALKEPQVYSLKTNSFQKANSSRAIDPSLTHLGALSDFETSRRWAA